MVVGFLAALTLIRHLSRKLTPDPRFVTNAALYSLLAGIAGARVFFVIHYFDQFRGSPFSWFAIWEGGLEFLGGVFFATVVLLLYLRHHKLPIRHYLDIIAIGLMLALAFGRIGCFLNGCCFGKPTSLPWGVCFPYGSFAYRSQIQANPQRNRLSPRLSLPEEYFGYNDEKGYYWQDLKPAKYLTPQQKELVTRGKYRCLAVHPTQLYSSAVAGVICLVLYLFWRRSQKAEQSGNLGRLFTMPGSTFALTFILYGTARFLMEFVRDDNPFEIDSLTISQVMGIGLIILGGILMAAFSKMRPEMLPTGARNAVHHHRPQKAAKSQ